MALELFKPPDSGVSFIDEYPELGDIAEFRDLDNKQMLFAYLMGCPSSPYFVNKTNDIKMKRTTCFAKAYGQQKDSEKTKFINGSYPESVRVAIERFARFRPSARMRAKVMVDSMFDNFEQMVNLSEEEKELINQDPDEMTKYVNNSKKVMDILPKLIQMKEHGFGISERGEIQEDDKGPTLFDLAVK